MRITRVLFAFVVVGFVAGFAQENPPPPLLLTGDAERGAAIANETCAACHGANGNSTVPTFPRLAGQVQPYLAVQLFVLKEGRRPSAIMNPIASTLSYQEIADLAAYFSGQDPAGAPWPGQDPALVERGGELFAEGDVEGGLIACAVCHGPAGDGVASLGVPRITGQAPGYLKGILAEFAQVPDFGAPLPNAMHVVASALSAEDTDAVIAYLASQPWGNP
ncbi:MAG: cytochrome c4 [Trueperaceae bacterium]